MFWKFCWYFSEKLSEYLRINKNEVIALTNTVNKQLSFIENQFRLDLKNIKRIRLNRMYDKMLWVKGQAL